MIVAHRVETMVAILERKYRNNAMLDEAAMRQKGPYHPIKSKM